jgi:hypothetical protein
MLKPFEQRIVFTTERERGGALSCTHGLRGHVQISGWCGVGGVGDMREKDGRRTKLNLQLSNAVGGGEREGGRGGGGGGGGRYVPS